MKTKILSGVVAVAIAAIAAVNVNFNGEAENALSGLSLANVEALASGEEDGGLECDSNCGGAYCGTFVHESGTSFKTYYC